ncbi:MAG TPA: hypothetical protein VKT78_02225 [Fimbriimonadaceae bacterium]|nr:hypothetical protein [Fimbriimonadaceae bacterium]
MKLSAFTWILFGICGFIVCLTFGWVTMRPNQIETENRHTNQVAAETEYNKEKQANTRVKKTQEEIEKVAQRWREIAATKTPPPDLAHGGIDISRNGAQLMVDSRQFRDSIQTAVNKQLRVGNVKLVGDGPRIPDPSESASTVLADFYNYPAIPFPVVIFDLGTITVSGTYEQIMANVRAWKDMPNYLAVSDGLRIDGTSPNMTGTYSVSIVGFVHGNKLFPSLPEVPGTTVAGGGGGGGGQGLPGNSKAAMGLGGGGRGPSMGKAGGG